MSVVTVQALDHVHLYVSNRSQSVNWLKSILGLQPFGSWKEDMKNPRHPVFMGTGDGSFCLSLFPGRPPRQGDRTVAFRVSAADFLAFNAVLPRDDIRAWDGKRLRPEDAADHWMAISHYFADFDGNQFELTTYETDKVRAVVGEVPVQLEQ